MHPGVTRFTLLAVLLGTCGPALAQTGSKALSASSPKLVPGPGPATFEMKGGAFRTTKGRGWVHTENEYTDFELEVEYRALSEKAEAYVAMRVPTSNDRAPVAGYFVTLPLPGGVVDAGLVVSTRIADKPTPAEPAGGSGTPTAGGVAAAARIGEWQRVVVRVDHDLVILTVKGQPQIAALARGPQVGHLGLESRRGTIEFRLFRVTPLETVPLCYSAGGFAVPKTQLEGLDRVPRPGPALRNPSVLREVRPAYTANAMRNKIQGTVQLEAVIRSDGLVGEVCVMNRLDSELDLQAVKAARQWRFTAATRDGTPTAVFVLIELTFTLR